MIVHCLDCQPKEMPIVVRTPISCPARACFGRSRDIASHSDADPVLHFTLRQPG